MKNLTLTLRLILLYVAVLLITPSSLSAQVVGQGLGTSKPIPEAPKPTKEEKKEAKEELENPEPQDRVLYLLENMNLEEKIAQLMFVRINGELSPNTVDSNLLQYLPPGGIVIPSLGRPDTMIDYTQVLQQLSGKAKFPIPFFIAGDAFTHLDSDTRNVNRFLTMPTRLAMGAAGKSNERTQLFNTLADDLKRTGFTMHLGPDLSMSNTLGVNRQSIYTFGNSPSSTADVAYELGEAFSSHDVLWAPQGFPGGSANRSGAGDSVMMTPSSVYLERDGFPYLAAIQAGAAVIHVGNTLVQQPDGSMLPASVSPITITTLLKGSLGFKGLALAGPIDTASMISKFEPEKATLLALQALLTRLSRRFLWLKIKRVYFPLS